MITPRHHIWGYGGDHYGYYGCGDIEDFVMRPRCCEQYWDMVGFDDVGSCREHYDEISYVDGYRDTWRLRIWEWAIGTLVIGGIVLILTLYCCWRRGTVKNLYMYAIMAIHLAIISVNHSLSRVPLFFSMSV